MVLVSDKQELLVRVPKQLSGNIIEETLNE